MPTLTYLPDFTSTTTPQAALVWYVLHSSLFYCPVHFFRPNMLPFPSLNHSATQGECVDTCNFQQCSSGSSLSASCSSAALCSGSCASDIMYMSNGQCQCKFAVISPCLHHAAWLNAVFLSVCLSACSDITNCLSCSNGNTCTSCVPSYFLKSTGSGVSCVTSSNCGTGFYAQKKVSPPSCAGLLLL